VYLKVTPDQERMILKLVGEGEHITRIARTTGLSRPTIYRVLGNNRRSSSRGIAAKK